MAPSNMQPKIHFGHFLLLPYLMLNCLLAQLEELRRWWKVIYIFLNPPAHTCSINRKFNIYGELDQVMLPTALHCHMASLLTRAPTQGNTGVPSRECLPGPDFHIVSCESLKEDQITTPVKVNNWPSVNQIQPSEMVIWQHTPYDNPLGLSLFLYPAWNKPLYCLSGGICAYSPDPLTSFNQRSTMLSLPIIGLWTWCFQTMHSLSSELCSRIGYHLLFSPEIYARGWAAFPFKLSTQKSPN